MGGQDLLGRLGEFHLFARGHDREIHNLMRGASEHLELALFDYSFVTGGGTLLADATGGSRAFAKALEREVSDALNLERRPIRADSPLLTGDGIEHALSLRRVAFRRAVRGAARGGGGPPLAAFDLGGRPAVILSPLDWSAGLVGTPMYACRGIAPGSSSAS